MTRYTVNHQDHVNNELTSIYETDGVDVWDVLLKEYEWTKEWMVEIDGIEWEHDTDTDELRITIGGNDNEHEVIAIYPDMS